MTVTVERQPAIVLLHGAFLSRAAWRPVEEALSHSCHLLSMDLPAHGSRAADVFSVPVAAAAVAAEIELRAAFPAVLAGHSLGGYVALAVAAARPDLVSGLVLSGSSRSPAAFTRGPFAFGLALLGVVPEALFDVCFRLLGARPWRRDDRRYIRSVLRMVRARDRGSLIPGRGPARAIRTLAQMDFWSALRSWRGPTLILNGDRDLFFRMGEEQVLRTARNARLVVLPGAGHQAPLEQPAAFARVVEQFAIECERLLDAGRTVPGFPRGR